MSRRDTTPRCRADSDDGWVCSLPPGHEGDHAAYPWHDTSQEPLEVWPVVVDRDTGGQQ